MSSSSASLSAERQIIGALPEPMRPLYQAIVGELEPFVEAESYAQAIARLEMVLRTVPSDQDNRLLRAALLAKRGELHMEAEDYEDAEDDIRHALQNGLRVPAIYALAGWTNYYLDQLEEARGHFERVLSDAPDDVSALKGRALVLQDLEELDEAMADLDKAIALTSDDATLYGMRAELLVGAGQLERATKDIIQARQIDPRDPDLAIAHARLLAVEGDIDGAVKVVDKALRQDDLSLEALLLRSHLRLVSDRKVDARADAMTATKRYPEEAFAFVQLAQVQLAEESFALALKAAERAVALDSSLPDAYLVRGAAKRGQGQEAEAAEDFKRGAQSPAELPQFIFGPAFEAIDGQNLHQAAVETMYGGTAPVEEPSAGGGNPFGGFPFGGMGGMGGMDPMRMMSQMFDDEGNIRPAFRPILRMALKNAPALLKNMPPGMLKGMGGMDPEMLKGMNLDNLSADDIEAQMKEVYKMMKSGQDPLAGARGGNDPNKK